ncbi:universal stress protein [Dissulfurirhabdus thermomarina]|uniref:Universal stress protein n=1 Tax=Dissulfurirhabdus thermomarina TaxID=1765737 RepID=A0A6N9TYB4_DISTH|nr:universal stress protein [Dissulfurirhabdus thermomarina]NDY43466.1 universal stress protein [Dissulfurirhabdus thermomarina]NMX23093.1 universal stress protein [Dissulfurirhabdus thermomarina]
MFKRLLIATDTDAASPRILECLPEGNPLGVEEIVLVHVAGPDAAGAADRIAAARRGLEARGFCVKVDLPAGVPTRAILEAADRHDASVIVVGSHHRGTLRGALVGSTSYSVLHETDRPVLLVRLWGDGACDAPAGPAQCLRHILFPTDFSETAERAFLYLEALARAAGSEVTLYHVHDRARIDPYLRDRLPEFDRVDRERLERLKAHLEANGAGPCHVEVSYGVPAQRILHLARNKDFSLVVMGTQGRGFLPEVYMGSTANAVARHGPLPVLFVPKRR